MIGMLWFDNSSDAITKRIERAVDYYQKKYGKPPVTIVLPAGDVPPADLPYYFQTHRAIFPNHMLVSAEKHTPEPVLEYSPG